MLYFFLSLKTQIEDKEALSHYFDNFVNHSSVVNVLQTCRSQVVCVYTGVKYLRMMSSLHFSLGHAESVVNALYIHTVNL